MCIKISQCTYSINANFIFLLHLNRAREKDSWTLLSSAQPRDVSSSSVAMPRGGAVAGLCTGHHAECVKIEFVQETAKVFGLPKRYSIRLLKGKHNRKKRF